MIEILIEVKGGVVTAVRSNHGDVNISLLDHDVLKERKGLPQTKSPKFMPNSLKNIGCRLMIVNLS